ncbi:MAG: hypothetical protein AB7U41_00825, partial [Dongiaceae bacterium]
YGLGDKTLYPPFSLERLSDSAFCLAVEMPCAPEPLVDIHLEGMVLVITAKPVDSSAAPCEYLFYLTAACRLAGASFNEGFLNIDLVTEEPWLQREASQLLQAHSVRCLHRREYNVISMPQQQVA